MTIPGIHHVTAITADAQKNIDFYCGVLGLRLVKLTVNFDDPQSYHLYYGDELGHPGTILTFFAWPGATPGRIGPPQAAVTAFTVPADAREYWAARLQEYGVALNPDQPRLGEAPLSFVDPDGLQLEIVPVPNLPDQGVGSSGPVPPAVAIRGFHGITLFEQGHEETARLLTEVMGFRPAGSEGSRSRYRTGNGEALGCTVDLVSLPNARPGRLGAGVVHHVAFRTPSDQEQLAWQRELGRLEYDVTPVMDRSYFHSIYFREPGGVLFEIATDPPGFTVDQPAAELGTRLMLPSWLEPHRNQLVRLLPPLRLPEYHVLGSR